MANIRNNIGSELGFWGDKGKIFSILNSPQYIWGSHLRDRGAFGKEEWGGEVHKIRIARCKVGI